MKQNTLVLDASKTAPPDIHLCGPSWVRRKRWPAVSGEGGTLRVVDLFSGCGGLTLGAWDAAVQFGLRFHVGLAIDIDKDAAQVYRENFNKFTTEQNIIAGDINRYFCSELNSRLTVVEKRLQQNVGEVDVLLAGSPCQGHSSLNNSSRSNDPRNRLYLAPIRAAQIFNPKVLLLENVPNVVHSADSVVCQAKTELGRLGYEVIDLVMKLDQLGVPQLRKRHILVAARSNLTNIISSLEKLRVRKAPSVMDFLLDCENEPEADSRPFYRAGKPTSENAARINHLFDNDLYELPNAMRPSCHRDKKHSYVSMYGRLYPNQPAQTITSGFGSMGQGRFVHPTRRRTITPHEAARIQGFPDFFSFSSIKKITALREMIGNAVPPALSSVLIQVLMREQVLLK